MILHNTHSLRLSLHEIPLLRENNSGSATVAIDPGSMHGGRLGTPSLVPAEGFRLGLAGRGQSRLHSRREGAKLRPWALCC